jgi:hypothetical protein
MKGMTIRRPMMDNQIDPFIPQWWANEVLLLLEENLISAALVNRDFEPFFFKYGDTVNIGRPGSFVGKRKSKNDEITIQDLTSDSVQVKLDQHCHVSFVVKDVEETMSSRSLIDTYARPAAYALARMVDRIVIGQYPRFLMNVAGKLNGIDDTNIKDYIIDLRQVMDENKAPENGRNVLLTPKTEADMLRPEWFTSADKVGDNGTALRTASLGQKLGFNFFKTLNAPNIAPGNTVKTGAVNNAAGYAAGTTVLTVDGITGAFVTGGWVDIDGVPYHISAHTETTGNTTSVTILNGLVRPVADNAPVTAYVPGAVNNASGYVAGYDKEITVDGFTVAPRVGQFVTFGTANDIYTVIDVTGLTKITLDRPLVNAIADDAIVAIGPAGAYNFAYQRDAMTLVIRPLLPVRTGTGALSRTLNFNGLSVRATIAYDPYKQQHIWTMDFLAGISLLDENLGAVLLG